MFDFHEKRKIRTWVYSKLTIGIILILAGLVLVSVYKRFEVEREMADRRAKKQDELELLEERSKLLEGKVNHLENERGLEEEIRTRFDVAREGEQVIIIVDKSEESKDITKSENVITEENNKSFLSWFKFW